MLLEAIFGNGFIFFQLGSIFRLNWLQVPITNGYLSILILLHCLRTPSIIRLLVLSIYSFAFYFIFFQLNILDKPVIASSQVDIGRDEKNCDQDVSHCYHHSSIVSLP